LKTWASQIRIGDPNDAAILTPITGLDEHLAQSNESTTQEPGRRPSTNPNGAPTYASRPADEDPDEDLRPGVRVHTTGSRPSGEPMPMGGPFGVSMPGGFGLDGGAFDAGGPPSAGGQGGPPSLREFPTSSILPMQPPMGAPRQSFGSGRAGWNDEEDGMQSDAPSTRSRRPTNQTMQGAFGATPSMDGGREARDRLNERGPRNERGRSTRTSSLADGTLSEPEEPNPRGRHARGPAPIPEDPRMYGQRVPVPMPVPAPMPAQQRGRSRHPPVSPDRSRSRSPSPSTTTRSRMQSRSRAQSRRRGPATDPAAMLIGLAGVQFVRVIEEYYATREGELSLQQGEVLAVIRREDRYWLGHSRGQVGRFPVEVVVSFTSPNAKNTGSHDIFRSSCPIKRGTRVTQTLKRRRLPSCCAGRGRSMTLWTSCTISISLGIALRKTATFKWVFLWKFED
jgi:hypothetical protein